MGLLDKIKENANNRISNDDLPLGNYDGVLKSINHGNAADYEVWRFIYEVQDQNHQPATLVDTMFVNSDPEKNEISYHSELRRIMKQELSLIQQ